VLRVDDALGRHTGLAITKSEKGKVSLKVERDKRMLSLKADDVADLTLTLSWDGDSNPDVLSGSGLNCFDITKGSAHAFVVTKMSAEPVCDEEAVASTCPQFAIESRVYDAKDPTGQRFSSSGISRGISIDSDQFIPFSNFTRKGPRGKGSFTCVGAVTVAFKFTGLRELDLTLGEISTNGEEQRVESSNRAAVTPVPREAKQSVGSVDSAKTAALVEPKGVPSPITPAKPRKKVAEEAVFGSLVAE
jgi:hypothetical protein